MLSTGVAGRTGVSESAVSAMLPGLAALTLAALAAQSEEHGSARCWHACPRWDAGARAARTPISPTSCAGAAARGPIPAASCRSVVRRCLAHAGRFGGFGALGWYVRFMLLRPASQGSPPAARPHLQLGNCAAPITSRGRRAPRRCRNSCRPPPLQFTDLLAARPQRPHGRAVLPGREFRPGANGRRLRRCLGPSRCRCRRGSGRPGRSCRRSCTQVWMLATPVSSACDRLALTERSRQSEHTDKHEELSHGRPFPFLSNVDCSQ